MVLHCAPCLAEFCVTCYTVGKILGSVAYPRHSDGLLRLGHKLAGLASTGQRTGQHTRRQSVQPSLYRCYDALCPQELDDAATLLTRNR